MVEPELKEIITTLAVMTATEINPVTVNSLLMWVNEGLFKKQADLSDIEKLQSEFKENLKEISRTAIAIAVVNDLIDYSAVSKNLKA